MKGRVRRIAVLFDVHGKVTERTTVVRGGIPVPI